jgi:hypothetical protein
MFHNQMNFSNALTIFGCASRFSDFDTKFRKPWCFNLVKPIAFPAGKRSIPVKLILF